MDLNFCLSGISHGCLVLIWSCSVLFFGMRLLVSCSLQDFETLEEVGEDQDKNHMGDFIFYNLFFSKFLSMNL